VYTAGSDQGIGPSHRHTPSDGTPPLWRGTPPPGRRSSPRPGGRVRRSSTDGPGGARRPRPGDEAAAVVRGNPPTPVGSHATAPCGRPCRRLWRGLLALCLCPERPARRPGLGVAVRFPRLHTRARSTLRASTPPSGVRHGAPPGGHARDPPGRARSAWPLSYAPASFCSPPVSGRGR
jgi:hypothetical protein